MKVIYISDASDERSLPVDEFLVFGGHTYCLVINGDAVRYEYKEYLPLLYYFSGWKYIHETWIGVFGVEEGIEPKAGIGVVFYNAEFDPASFLNVNKYYTSGGVVFNDSLLLSCSEDDGTDSIRFFSDLSDDCDRKIYGMKFSSSFLVEKDILICGWYSGGMLARLDGDLNVIWRRDFSNKDVGVSKNKVFQYKDTAITRLGQLLGTDIKSQIISLDTKTGNTVWQVDLPFYVNHCILIGDRIYLSSALDWNWCVLSADTGDIILQGKVTLPEEHNRIGWLWADSGYLFLDYHSESLHVLDENTGELIQDIALPDEFSLSGYPEVKGDYIYFRLGTSGEICEFNAYGGVMILSREELRQGPPWTIEVEDKGDISYQAIADGKTEYYEINASYEELGDVLRFGQIEIKLVAQRYAYNHWGNLDDNWRTRINKKFDGRIILNIDKAKLRNSDEAKFDLMVELFNKHFEKKFRAPANKKKPLTLSWKYI